MLCPPLCPAMQVESASVVVVPLGTHTAPGGPALLLPPRTSKLPGAADVAEGALLAESAALSRLVRRSLAGLRCAGVDLATLAKHPTCGADAGPA